MNALGHARRRPLLLEIRRAPNVESIGAALSNGRASAPKRGEARFSLSTGRASFFTRNHSPMLLHEAKGNRLHPVGWPKR
jgi:hypothetical protein